MIQIKVPNCNICNKTVDTFDNLNTHMHKVHQESDNDRMIRLQKTFQSALENEKLEKCSTIPKVTDQGKTEVKANTASEQCELCDKIFPNRVQKSNHKLLVHTVRDERLQCDYCDDIHYGLMNLCKHISSKHNHLFF